MDGVKKTMTFALFALVRDACLQSTHFLYTQAKTIATATLEYAHARETDISLYGLVAFLACIHVRGWYTCNKMK